jgi:aspartyl-tRNA(Asn)/glutamyl-tRNA(Gln) amidotransferase subunit C
MKITRDDVLYVAELAHLELTEAEVEMYREQLDEILSYIAKLNELDTTAVEPMAQALAPLSGERPQTAWRDDVERASGVTEAALAGAPDGSKPYFRVPKVIER